MRITVVVVAWLLLMASPGFAENIDPDAVGAQYAYAANTGWCNAEPGGDGSNGATVRFDRLSGYLWCENIGWISLSCENTGSCDRTDYGVTNSVSGSLSGYAWSENAGWISFSCENTGSCANHAYGVAVDPTDGKFSGYAWGENIGWINFDSQSQVIYMIATSWKAQPDVIAGSVWLNIAGHEGLSVKNALVVLEGTGHSASTDDRGHFVMMGVAPGTYTMTITAEGMAPLKQQLTLLEGQPLYNTSLQMTVLTQSDLNQAVADAIALWDSGADGKIGLEEAVRALQVVSGQRAQ